MLIFKIYLVFTWLTLERPLTCCGGMGRDRLVSDLYLEQCSVVNFVCVCVCV